MASQIGVIDHSSYFMASSPAKAFDAQQPISHTSMPVNPEDSSAEVSSIESGPTSPTSSRGHRKNKSSSSSVPRADSPLRPTSFSTTSPNLVPAKLPQAPIPPLDYNSGSEYPSRQQSSVPATGRKQLSLYREQATSPFEPPASARFGKMHHTSFSESHAYPFPGQQQHSPQQQHHNKSSHPPSAFSNRASPLFPRNSDPGQFANYPRQPSPPKRRATFSRSHVPHNLNLDIQSDAPSVARNHRRRSSYAYQASSPLSNNDSAFGDIIQHTYASPSDLASPNTLMTHHQLHDMISRGLPFSFLPMSTHQVLALCEDHSVLEAQLSEYSLLVEENDKLIAQLETERARVETVQSQLIQMNELNLTEKKKNQEKIDQLEAELSQQGPRIKELEQQLAEAEKRLSEHESTLELEFSRWKQKAELERAETSEAHARALQKLHDSHAEEKKALDTAYLTKIDSLMNAHSVERAKLLEALEAREKLVERARSGSIEDVTKTRRNLAKRHEEEIQSLKRAHADKLSAMDEFHRQEKGALLAKFEKERNIWEAERDGLRKGRSELEERVREMEEDLEDRTVDMKAEYEEDKAELLAQFAREKKRMEKEAADAKRRLEEEYRRSKAKIEATFGKIKEEMEAVLDQATDEWESDKQRWEVEKEDLVEKVRRARGEFDEERERMEKMIRDLKIDKDCLVKENSRLNKVLKKIGNSEEGNENWCKGDAYYEGAFEALMNAIVEISKQFSVLPTTDPVPRYALDYLPAGLTWELIRSPNPSSQYLRQSFVQHTISRLLCQKIFNPFVFTLTKSSNRISTYLQTLSEDLRKKSTRREAVWRMYTMSAVFQTSSSKKAASIIATTVQEEIIDLLSPFLEARRLDSFKSSLGKIVKLAVETWRYARMEKEVFSARMEQLAGDGPDSWLEHPYSSLGGLHPTVSSSSQYYQSGQGTIFLPLLPLISREGTVPSAANPDAALDDGHVFTPGFCLYTTSAPLVLRKQELLTEPKSLTPRSSYRSMIPLPVTKGGRVSPMPGEDRERERARRREERKREREIEERLEREEKERMEFEAARMKVKEEMMSRSGIVGVGEFRLDDEDGSTPNVVSEVATEPQNREHGDISRDADQADLEASRSVVGEHNEKRDESEASSNITTAIEATQQALYDMPTIISTTSANSRPASPYTEQPNTSDREAGFPNSAKTDETTDVSSNLCEEKLDAELGAVTSSGESNGDGSECARSGTKESDVTEHVIEAQSKEEAKNADCGLAQSEEGPVGNSDAVSPRFAEGKVDAELGMIRPQDISMETTVEGVSGEHHAVPATTNEDPAWIGLWQNDRGVWGCVEPVVQVETGRWWGMDAVIARQLHWQTGEGWWKSENTPAWQNGEGYWTAFGASVYPAAETLSNPSVSMVDVDEEGCHSEESQVKVSEDRTEPEDRNDVGSRQDSGSIWASSVFLLQSSEGRWETDACIRGRLSYWQTESGSWKNAACTWQPDCGSWQMGLLSRENEVGTSDLSAEAAVSEEQKGNGKQISMDGHWQAGDGSWKGCEFRSQFTAGRWLMCDAESDKSDLFWQGSGGAWNSCQSSSQEAGSHWLPSRSS
ncbi:hypothetical protein BJ508DRAFT_328922 [Ascobolus immersus RN42]|uniref:Uncharacterized protein n=1 Tax=Ascobolus immersus RN42 TaxID=1160509 RepID=A0A3N4I253_ASCIM|nr:hypothetical protein BJ508DRAFT_328922 [Ascobolus immersus RN42]